MPELSVGPAPVPIYSVDGGVISGQNNSGYPLYLSDSPDLSSTNYHAVVTGNNGDFTWPENKPLYVCCDPGRTIVITYVNNGARINNPVTTVGLKNQLTLIGKYTFTGVMNAPFTLLASTPLTGIDVSAYASIIVNPICTIVTGTATNSGRYHSVTLGFSSDGQTAQTIKTAEWLIQGDPLPAGKTTHSFQVPVTGQTLLMSWTAFPVSALTVSTATIEIYGSTESILAPRYRNNSGSFLGDIPSSGILAFDQTASISQTRFINNSAGVGTMSMFVRVGSGAGVTAQLNIMKGGLIYPNIIQRGTASLLELFQAGITIPYAPASVSSVTVAGTSLTYSLVMQ